MEEEKWTDKDKKPRRYYSPSSKASVMTPIKTALYTSNKQTEKFIKEIKKIVKFNRNKENVDE